MMVKWIEPVGCTYISKDQNLVDYGCRQIKKVKSVSIRGVEEGGTVAGVNFYNIVKDGEHDLTVTVEQKELVARGVVAERDPLAHITIDFWVEEK